MTAGRKVIQGAPCAGCGSRDTYAVLVPAYGWGHADGTRDVTEVGCNACGRVEAGVAS